MAGPALCAIGLLTRLPVGTREFSEREVVLGALFFPIVGAALGAVVGLTAASLDRTMSATLAAAIVVGLEITLTGALHLDGTADTFDGLAGNSAGRRLEIMRDHALGTFGAAAVVWVIVVKTAAIASLLEAGDETVRALVATYAISRVAPLPLAAALPYARDQGGTGQALAEQLDRGLVVGALAATLVLAVLLVGTFALVIAAGAGVAVGCAAAYGRLRLGGVTGDLMGAAVETSLAAGLILAAAV